MGLWGFSGRLGAGLGNVFGSIFFWRSGIFWKGLKWWGFWWFVVLIRGMVIALIARGVATNTTVGSGTCSEVDDMNFLPFWRTYANECSISLETEDTKLQKRKSSE